MGLGYLTVKTSMAEDAIPVEGASVSVQDNNGRTLYTLTTDASGKTEMVELFAPDKIYDLDPNYNGATYSTYRVTASRPGFVTEIINGVQVFDTVEALQEVNMHPVTYGGEPPHEVNIPPHEQVLKIPQNQQGPAPSMSGQVLPRVIIPDFITVHLGRYDNANARNIRVPFPLYIKNVASSEIYPTWPEASLEANIRAIMNFALNRVYTGWYRTRGYNFDITSSTATDMYFVEGRDIFANLGVIADRIIGEYLRRPNHMEPFFTSFCDGRTAQCAGLLQWGTVTLANRGYTPMQILRYYYPNDLMIDTAPIAAITESFPGVPLSQGAQGSDVELMQKYLNRIRQNYPLIPNIASPNGIFGTDTVNAVRMFQQMVSLPQTGIIDRATWNRIFRYYVAVAKLSDLNSEGDRIVTSNIPPNTVISMGAKGGLVTRLQFMLNYIAQFYPEIPTVTQDGSFGSGTRNAVAAFQDRFNLTPDGVVGPLTWVRLYEVFLALRDSNVTQPPAPPPTGPVYPGTPLRVGSSGESVRIMQEYLNALSAAFPSIPRITADGIFGPLTETAVIAFQRQFGLSADGVIGPITWNAIVTQYNALGTTQPPQPPPTGPAFPGTPLRVGSTGESVRIMQEYLNALSGAFPSIPPLAADGVFGPITETAVIAFQRHFGLAPDGIIGPITWNAIVTQYNNLQTTPPQYFIHTVRAGDTLWLLAQRFGTTVDAIKTLNGLTSDLLNIGQQLKIPVSHINYTVQPGDSLWMLAQRFGTTVDAIKTLNNLASDLLNIGQRLRIPTAAPVSVIVIDAGHGGSDLGAVSGTRLEKDDNLRMALAVRDRLQARGQRVIMTRSTDVFIPLDERSAISNRNNADIFVSIHRNASTNPTANGMETYVQNNAAPINVRYAQNVHGELVSAGVQNNGGVRQGNYAVLRNTQAPAMMAELGYITNTLDNQLFDENFNAYADAIADGILISLAESYPPPVPLSFFNYIVQTGDNLWSIAQRFGTTMEAIISLNNFSGTNITVGQIIRVPNVTQSGSILPGHRYDRVSGQAYLRGGCEHNFRS